MTTAEFRDSFGPEAFGNCHMWPGRSIGESLHAVCRAIDAAEVTYRAVHALGSRLSDEHEALLSAFFGRGVV